MEYPRIGLYCFSNDLRLHDNPALAHAAASVDQLLCLYIDDTAWRSTAFYPAKEFEQNQYRFLHQSLSDLDSNLRAVGQSLHLIKGDTVTELSRLIRQFSVADVFRSDQVGYYENKAWQILRQQQADVQFHSIDTHTLFKPSSLPFAIDNLAAHFTPFKQAVKHTAACPCVATLMQAPPPPEGHVEGSTPLADFSRSHDGDFIGGESPALAHLHDYFSSTKPLHYKQVRNALDGWDNSSKLSPWLANGCLSVRWVYSELQRFENRVEANESTYWLYFELLWREYFQWYALKHGVRLFTFSGVTQRAPLTSHYSERLQKWLHGNTPYPIVNACMNQLRETGYLSNRGRQIAASCLVNELALDWRFGAAYFEAALIDYDVASNWGNWQYIAGVGADPRGGRHFNLNKQTEQFDPYNVYIDKWNGDSKSIPLDSRDAADWPV